MLLPRRVATRNDPDMPRCITSTSPEERSASRYFARRPSPSTRLPSSRATKSFGSGQRRSPRCASTLVKRAPSMTGCSPRRTVSTSGSSGIRSASHRASGVPDPARAKIGGASLPMRTKRLGADIASLRLPRYGPAEKGLFAMPRTGEMADFGFQRLPLEHKQARVDDVFRSVARRYDLMNDLMSGGLHRAWKDALVTAVDPPKHRPSGAAGARPFALLDLARGTGDIAFRVVEAGGGDTRATVVDINAEMLAVGHARAVERRLDETITFIEGNAEALPFPDRCYDAVTI